MGVIADFIKRAVAAGMAHDKVVEGVTKLEEDLVPAPDTVRQMITALIDALTTDGLEPADAAEIVTAAFTLGVASASETEIDAARIRSRLQ